MVPYPNGSWTTSWSAVSEATSYNSHVTDTATNTTTATNNGTGTSITRTNPLPGTYVVGVQACNASGCSGWTNSGTVTVFCTTAPLATKGKANRKGVQPYLVKCP
jgi:hypothetical protein